MSMENPMQNNLEVFNEVFSLMRKQLDVFPIYNNEEDIELIFSTLEVYMERISMIKKNITG